ncbi:hypothetical protein [Lignipirellula cremea]|uniref:Uncharacterized protein n=1 Tax=Lignipirellula cremea TaxID=2528010 RepID=A0A518DSZ3_9BACT|nr:hypothetical protein [Lignipirellula cremea]QDU94959.1 hypothetical protein Pla8534_27680 [Lignipirellula cremea]
MVKKFFLAMVPMMLMASVTLADDGLLDGLDLSSIQDAEISIEGASSDLDFDSLAGQAGEEAEGDEAIEACFRSFGYRSYGRRSYGFGGYGGYGGYGYGCYRPTYSRYYCYRPTYYRSCYTSCYRPVRYWGCW